MMTKSDIHEKVLMGSGARIAGEFEPLRKQVAEIVAQWNSTAKVEVYYDNNGAIRVTLSDDAYASGQAQWTDACRLKRAVAVALPAFKVSKVWRYYSSPDLGAIRRDAFSVSVRE